MQENAVAYFILIFQYNIGRNEKTTKYIGITFLWDCNQNWDQEMQSKLVDCFTSSFGMDRFPAETGGINVSTLDSNIRNTSIPRDFINKGTETLDGSTVNPLLWCRQHSKFQLMFSIFFVHDSLKNNLN
jgi:hypothetical protein